MSPMSAQRSAKDKTKRIHEGFFSKLIDTFQRLDSGPSVPPKLPQGPVQPDYKRPDPLQEQYALGGFSKLSISDPPSSTSTPSNAPFIGGFDPRQISGFDTYTAGPSHIRPVSMPAPQSLTMQMALEPVQDNNNQSFYPQSNQLLPSPRPQTNTSSASSSPARSAISVSSPAKPNNKSDLSISSGQSTSSKKSGGQRCAGVTKAGKQCSRIVKTGYAPLLEPEDAVFCFQHTKEIMSPSGYYSRKNGEWVKFQDWIPSYLQAATQVSLRIEMEKARTQSDVPGYIYTFEIRETRESETIKLKVGRAVNLVKRIDQWGKQCGSKEQVLRGFYPGTVEPDNAGDGSTSLMKGRVIAGEKGPWCHRLERLIHIELSDLTCNCVYLDPSWPNIDTVSSASPSAIEVKGSSKGEHGSVPCVDCGSIHKEIFEFRRWKQGKNKGKEWDNLVKPVVERWGKPAELGSARNLFVTMEDPAASTSQSTPNPNGGYGNDKEGDAKRAQEEQMRRDLLATVLDTAARERLSRIALVSPDRSKQIETILLRMAQSGQLKNRVTEEQLIDLLNQMEQAGGKTTVQKSTIVYRRRKGLEDDFDF